MINGVCIAPDIRSCPVIPPHMPFFIRILYPLATADGSVTGLAVYGCTYRGDTAVCSLWYLAPFTQHAAFEIHPRRCVYQQLIFIASRSCGEIWILIQARLALDLVPLNHSIMLLLIFIPCDFLNHLWSCYSPIQKSSTTSYSDQIHFLGHFLKNSLPCGPHLNDFSSLVSFFSEFPIFYHTQPVYYSHQQMPLKPLTLFFLLIVISLPCIFTCFFF